jgi:hypothetical protein
MKSISRHRGLAGNGVVVWLNPMGGDAGTTNVERALRHLRDAVPAIGVAIDTTARLGVVYDGGVTALFTDLDDGDESFSIPVPGSTLQRLARSDATDFGLADAASEALAHFVGIARRDRTVEE